MKKYLPILICLLFTITELNAQWVQTNGPYGGNISCITTCPNELGSTNIFAGTGGNEGNGHGVFLSTNNGISWTAVNNGLPTWADVKCIIANGTNIFAGLVNNNFGMYRSTDNGANWTAVNNGIPSNRQVVAMAVSGSNIFAATVYSSGAYSGGVYRSTDNGANWTAVNNGLPQSSNPNDDVYGYTALTVSGNNIFLGSSVNGIYRSTDNGANWTYCGFKDTTVYSFAVLGSNIFAGTWNRGIFRSSNNGESWIPVNNGLWGLSINALVVSGTSIFAGTGTGGVSISTDEGTNWTQINNGLPTNYWVTSLAAFPNGTGGTNILVGNIRGVYLSTNNGENWTEVDNGLTGVSNYALAVIGNNLFAGTTSCVFHSTDNGSSWTPKYNGLISCPNLYAEAMAVSGPNLYAAISPFGVGGNGICVTTDNGNSWNSICDNYPMYGISSLAVQNDGKAGTNIFVGTWSEGIFFTTNNGTNWTALNNGLTDFHIRSLAIVKKNLFAVTYNGTFLSTNNGASWTKMNTDFTAINGVNVGVLYVAVLGNYIFANSGYNIFVSTDMGTSWKEICTFDSYNYSVLSFAVSDENIFVGTYNGQVWKFPLPEIIKSSIWSSNITIKDNGNISQQLYFGQSPTATDSIDSDIGESPLPPPAFGFDARFHLPTGDDSWKDFRTSSEDTVKWLIKFQPGDGGYPITFSWDKAKLPKGSCYLKDIITGSIVNVNMKTDSSYILTNTGINELNINYSDTTNANPMAITKSNELPNAFSLSQNYPNPFNPTTTIKYGLPSASNVRIKIYNLLGQEVETLVDTRQDAGYHQVTWNASGKASGIYLYTIEAISADGKGNFSSAKKLILLK